MPILGLMMCSDRGRRGTPSFSLRPGTPNFGPLKFFTRFSGRNTSSSLSFGL